MTRAVRPAILAILPVLAVGLLIFALAQAFRSPPALPVVPRLTPPTAAPAVSPEAPAGPVEATPLTPSGPATIAPAVQPETSPSTQAPVAPSGPALSAPPAPPQTKDAPGPGRPMGDNDPPWPYQREKGPFGQ